MSLNETSEYHFGSEVYLCSNFLRSLSALIEQVQFNTCRPQKGRLRRTEVGHKLVEHQNGASLWRDRNKTVNNKRLHKSFIVNNIHLPSSALARVILNKQVLNRLRSIYQYSNMAPRLSGQNCRFAQFRVPKYHQIKMFDLGTSEPC